MFDELPTLDFKPARNPSLALMLSLFLILLVFFVMLNTFSRPVEEKQAAAIYGVREGFDYRNTPAEREGDMLAESAGPAWFEDVDAKVRGVVERDWPGAQVASSVDAGVVDVKLMLSDAWAEDGWEDGFVALAQNLKAVLADVSDVYVRVVIEAAGDEQAAAQLGALGEALPEMNIGWSKAEKSTPDTVRIVVGAAYAMPAELAKATGAKAAKILPKAGETQDGQ